jgi:hypothetical protein
MSASLNQKTQISSLIASKELRPSLGSRAEAASQISPRKLAGFHQS